MRRRMSRLSAIPLTITLCATGALCLPTAHAADPTTDPTAMETEHAQLSRQLATQGMVLLENDGKALPMASKGNVAVYGVGSYKTVKGGTGSGAVNNRYNVSVRDGLEKAGYSITTSDAYYQAMKKAYDDKYLASEGNLFGATVDYSSVEQLLTSDTVKPTALTNTAIYVVARNSGEGADRSSGKGDYLLSDTERADLTMLGTQYRNVVVVLNTGGIIDTTFFKQVNSKVRDPKGGKALDAMLLMSQAGQEGGSALVDVLNGTVAPSGKLTDTWASAYRYYPASETIAKNDGDSMTENYDEGIYVGYRWFDSKYKSLNAYQPASVVNYPFGYGLGYSTFRTDAQQVTADMSTVTIKAKVTNTGKYAGREVVQAYFSAPTAGLDKPYQELAGYAKTDVLKPGQSQVVTISYDTTQMSSYDTAKANYVMDAGQYIVRVGNSSRNTHVAAKLELAKRTVTERLHNELDSTEGDSRQTTSDPSDFYSYRAEAREIARAKSLKLDTKHFRATTSASDVEQDVTVDESSPYYDIDGSLMSSVRVYLSKAQTDWEGTGKAYQPKTGESVRYVKTDSKYTLYDVQAGRISMEQFVASLSLTELANLVEGTDAKGSVLSAAGTAGYTTPLYENKGVPGMSLSDGPAGLRITQKVPTEPVTYQYATAFPIGTLLAQSWDADVLQRFGVAVGEEMNHFGATMWLAPGMNIHRDPMCGRNFEYYSEDPLLTGTTAANATLGVQSNPGVGVTVKHYAANNQETDRFGSDAVVSERALREVYLKGFEIAVKQAQPMAVMSSYNSVNGTLAEANYDLLTDVLRGEWNFQGVVMTDWTSISQSTPTAVMYAGNDLIEPGNGADAVIGEMKQLTPSIDVSGIPTYDQNLMKKYGFTMYSLKLGSWTMSPTGTDTIVTKVDSSTDLTKVTSTQTVTDEINNITSSPRPAYSSVDEAYKDAVAVTSRTGFGGLTTAQKEAITFSDVQHATAGDESSPVVSYTVTLKGNYPAKGYAMRLGDLQRSAMRVLNAAMQTTQFQQLAELQGVAGVEVGSYSSQFDLSSPFTAKAAKVKG